MKSEIQNSRNWMWSLKKKTDKTRPKISASSDQIVSYHFTSDRMIYILKRKHKSRPKLQNSSDPLLYETQSSNNFHPKINF